MRKSGDGKKSIVQKKANVFEIGPKKAEPEPVVEEKKDVAPAVEIKKEEVVPAPAPAAPAMDITALAQQLAAIQALLSGTAPAPVMNVTMNGVEMVNIEREATEIPAEDVEKEAVEAPADAQVEDVAEPVPEDSGEVADGEGDDKTSDDDESSESSVDELPIEVVQTDMPHMVLMYKFYRDIFNNFNWMKKFKDDGRLILTPNQLVAFLALVCDIERSCIRIQCDMKPKRIYSDGKIFKVVKIGIETEKELPDLEKVFKNYNISAEYINYSEKLMTIDY